MGYRLNCFTEPVFIEVSKLLLTEFGIHHRLESCWLALLILKYSALEFHSNHAGEGKLLPIVLYSFCCSYSCQKIPHAILCDGLFSIMHKMAAPAYLWIFLETADL